MTAPAAGYAPVFQLTRGGIVESLHFGAAAVVDASGRLLAGIGDPRLVTFMRSSAKPFQAMPFIENGGPGRLGFSAAETALICASHSGSDDHIQAAEAIQAKAGISENDLQCGVHLPYDRTARARLQASGETPTANRHNCSGKHSGMLAYARMMGWPLGSYLELSHPLQREILAGLADFSGIPASEIIVGIDGCSAPNFALPLYNAALAFARLADPTRLAESRAAACRAITAAMTGHPEMVAGAGEFDTRLMEVGDGRWVVKGGAEGYQAVGLLPGALGAGTPGVGITMKIADGGQRELVRTAVTLEILRLLGALSEADLIALDEFGPVVALKNFRSLSVGEASPCFELHAA